MNKVITTKDLVNYLKIPDFIQKVNQEIVVVKITKEKEKFQEEVMLLKDFPRENREISIPQTLYIDVDNVAYTLYAFNNGKVFYKNISYEKDERVFSSTDFSESLTEVIIPDELYYGGFQFYIDTNNHLVAMMEIVHLDNSKDYINFRPEDFSNFTEKTYHYTNVYGVKANEKLEVVINSLKASVHRFPILSKELGSANPYSLSYYYKKDAPKVIPTFLLDEDEVPTIALRISFKNLSTVMSFLKDTIFNYFNEVNDFRSKWRHQFLKRIGYHITPVANKSSLKDKKALIYQIPEPLYYVFYNNTSLWAAIETLAKGNITDVLGTNEEDLILKLLKIIYHRRTHKQIKDTIGEDKREVLTEEEKKYTVDINNNFITNLITRKVDGKLLLYKLVKGLDGKEFQTYVYFIWNIWKNSSYANINPKTNKLIDITEKSPVLLDYRSDTALGFHYDNAEIHWEGEQAEIDVKVRVKVGTKEVQELINIGDASKPRYIDTGNTEVVDDYQAQQYNYHPFAPIVLVNSKNPKFILKEKDTSNTLYIKLPAFVLFANNKSTFWKNVLKGSEYLVDVLTTVSGVGNIIKAGRIYNLLKKGKTLVYKTAQVTKAIGAVKAAAGVIEVSSGTVNTLLKLTELDDTELGRTISKYLFYLEMVALAGEVSSFVYDKLYKTARELVENPKFEKSLDNLVKEGRLDEVGKQNIRRELRASAGMARDTPTRIDAKEFLESARKLAKINPEQALEYLDEALKHFNHYVKDNKVYKVSNLNCVNVVQVVDDYLKTGIIKLAKPTKDFLPVSILRDRYNRIFDKLTIPQMKNVIKEGERGIIYGVKEVYPFEKGHVFNVVMVKGELRMVDGQSGKLASIGFREYKYFKYLKTN
ncbi:hypothetical protein [uncultured Tenacibaculum sp.]|nr:hypothetical protein [uncultured Tenacibaculum sp.]